MNHQHHPFIHHQEPQEPPTKEIQMNKTGVRAELQRQHPNMPIHLLTYFTNKISRFFRGEQIGDFTLTIIPTTETLPYTEPHEITLSFRPSYHS